MAVIVDKILDFLFGGPSEVMVWGGRGFLAAVFHFNDFVSIFFPFLFLDSTDASEHSGRGHVCSAFVSKDTIYHGE